MSLRELLKRFCVNDVLFVVQTFISLLGWFLIAISTLHAGMHLISWGLTCSYASVLVEGDLVLGGERVKRYLCWFRSSPVSCTGVLCLGNGVGGEQEAECTRRPKEMGFDAVRIAAVPQDSTAQKWPLQGAKSLFWAAFQPWYCLIMINLLELRGTLAQVDRTQFQSVPFYVCAGNSAAPHRCTVLQLFPWTMKQVQSLDKNGGFLKSWPAVEESL